MNSAGEHMEVSVVVPCYNEEANIGNCLKTLVAQTYPLTKYEVVVADGGSSDLTQEIVRNFAQNHPNVKLVIERKKGVAAGRNAGIRFARYEHIAFIDADCEAPSDWLAVLTRNLQAVKSKDKDVVGVGGKNIAPVSSNRFLKAVDIALDSYIGSFGSIQGRQFTSPIFVSSISTANALYDKRKLVEIGYFDESLQSEAEDAEINYRLYSRGFKFLFLPGSFVWHKMRSTPPTWMKNMFRYGKGRARLLKRYPDMWNVTYLLPLLFIGSMALTCLGSFSGIFFMPLIYFPALFLFSAFQCARKRQIGLIAVVTLAYLIQHFGYAYGELYGLINPKAR